MRNEAPPTPINDILWAKEVERRAKSTPELYSKYLEYMNNVPMSKRTGGWEIRDGCIISGLFQRICLTN